MSLMRLVYASESRLVEVNRRAELARMIATAQRLNADNHVTGFLLATPKAFAQVLEGAAANVAETYGRIVVDPRHANLRLLVEEPIERRGFADWSMALSDKDETSDFIFSLYGVTPDADLYDQPADTLLDLAGELASRIR